jgi:hypothetical protein
MAVFALICKLTSIIPVQLLVIHFAGSKRVSFVSICRVWLEFPFISCPKRRCWNMVIPALMA